MASIKDAPVSSLLAGSGGAALGCYLIGCSDRKMMYGATAYAVGAGAALMSPLCSDKGTIKRGLEGSGAKCNALMDGNGDTWTPTRDTLAGLVALVGVMFYLDADWKQIASAVAGATAGSTAAQAVYNQQ